MPFGDHDHIALDAIEIAQKMDKGVSRGLFERQDFDEGIPTPKMIAVAAELGIHGEEIGEVTAESLTRLFGQTGIWPRSAMRALEW